MNATKNGERIWYVTEREVGVEGFRVDLTADTRMPEERLKFRTEDECAFGSLTVIERLS